MKAIIITILLIGTDDLFAQTSDSINGKMPRYRIRMTSMDTNMLKGLLLRTKDSSIVLYPGKKQEWRSNVKYNAVEFDYRQIQQVSVKKKNGALKGMLIGGGIGTAIFAGSFLFPNRMEKMHHGIITFFAIPTGLIAGAIAGSMKWKKNHINGSRSKFNEFKNKVQ